MAVGGDIASYINNNTVKLSNSNYNELDAIVFSQLSYSKFENLSGYPGTNYGSVKDYAQACLNNHAYKEGDKDMVAFLQALAKSDRYADCSISNLAANNDTSQWAAMTVNIDNKNSVIAMRGTDGTEKGWIEDFELGYKLEGTEAQKLSAEYLKNSDVENIYLAGHSKGGNDVISAYVQNDKSVRDKVVRIDNFDGPGVNGHYALINGDGYIELSKKLYNYYPENSVIGQLLVDKPGHNTYFKCDMKGHTESMGLLGEHDPFSFKLNSDQTGFSKCDQSITSKIINNLIDVTLLQLDPIQQALFMRLIINIGIPAVIAHNNDLSYINYDFLNNISIKEIAELGNFYYVLIALLRSLIPALGIVGLEKAIEIISQAFDKVLAKLKKYGDKIYKEVKSIYKKGLETVGKVWNYFKSWGSSGGGHSSGHGRYDENHSAGNGKADFAVDINKLLNYSKSLKTISKDIGAQRNGVNSAQHSLIIGSSVVAYIKFEIYETNITAIAKKLENMAATLENVAHRYDSTESKIAGNIGF